MLKKLLGMTAVDAAPPPPDVPSELPALEADASAVAERMDLPWNIRRHMNLPQQDPADVAQAVAASEGEDALAKAAAEGGGESVPLLGALVRDPRFALITTKFLAFGLKKEAALLWAVESATLGYAIRGEQDAEGATMPEAEREALAAALAAKDGESALAAQKAAEAAGLQTPAGLAAQAAAWQAASPPVEQAAADKLLGGAVAGAVTLAAAMTLPDPPKPEVPEPSAPVAPELAAKWPEPPSVPLLPDKAEEIQPMADALAPFLKKGLEIASRAV